MVLPSVHFKNFERDLKFKFQSLVGFQNSSKRLINAHNIFLNSSYIRAQNSNLKFEIEGLLARLEGEQQISRRCALMRESKLRSCREIGEKRESVGSRKMFDYGTKTARCCQIFLWFLMAMYGEPASIGALNALWQAGELWP